jgi:metal-responsive CopG/Arc/MetJ family transcriptional regulator
MKRRREKNANSGDDGNYLPQIGVRLPHDQIQELDEFAIESAGRLNRSDLIRQAIDNFLPILREQRNRRRKKP